MPADPRTMPKAECPSRGITPATILFDSKYTTIATPRRGVPPYTLDEDEDVKMIGFRINIFNASMSQVDKDIVEQTCSANNPRD